MATNTVRDLADHIVDNCVLKVEGNRCELADPIVRGHKHQPRSRSSLETSEICDFSTEVDNWIRGDSPVNTGVQGTSLTTAQHSTMAPSRSITNGICYLAAMVMPLITANNDMLWRCTPSTVLNTVQVMLTHMSQVCGQARSRLRRLVMEQTTRDVFATAIDFALVIYAIGFLVLSLYQAYILSHIENCNRCG